MPGAMPAAPEASRSVPPSRSPSFSLSSACPSAMRLLPDCALAEPGRELVKPGGEAAVAGGEPFRAGGRLGQPGQEPVAFAGVDPAQALPGALAGRVCGADRVVLESLDDHPKALDGLGDLVVCGAEPGSQFGGAVTQSAGAVGGLAGAIGGLAKSAGDATAAVAELPGAGLGLPGARGDLVEGVAEVAGPGGEPLQPGLAGLQLAVGPVQPLGELPELAGDGGRFQPLPGRLGDDCGPGPRRRPWPPRY